MGLGTPVRVKASTIALTTSLTVALTVALMAALTVAPGTVRAETLAESAARIEAMIAAGENEAAAAAARDFLRQVTAQTGFGVTHARLTTAPATGFGVYHERPDNVFAPGELIYAYVEAYGFSMEQLPNGANQLLFDVSFTLETPDGEPLTESMVPMGEVRLRSYSETVDCYFHLSYRISGAAGAYNLRTHVVDRLSGQSADFILPIVIAAPDHSGGGALGGRGEKRRVDR